VITLTKEQRIAIVQYRMENANNTLKEVESHIQNGFYNTAVNRMYYACYYAASAMLIAKGVETKSHDGVSPSHGGSGIGIKGGSRCRIWSFLQPIVFKTRKRRL